MSDCPLPSVLQDVCPLHAATRRAFGVVEGGADADYKPQLALRVSDQVATRLFFPGVIGAFDSKAYYNACAYDIATRAYESALRDLSEMEG